VKPLTARELLIWLTLVVGFFAYTRWDAKRDGKLKEQARVADSIAVVRLEAQRLAHDSAVRARAEADSMRRLIRYDAERDARTRAKTDSVIARSGAEREAALRVAADSAATIGELRGSIIRLAQRGVADSVAFAVERDSLGTTIRDLRRTVDSHANALRLSTDAENKAIARAVSAENQRDIERKRRPSILSRCGLSAGYAANDKGFGPGLLLGCRIAP
jgi:hypothetical protein